MEWDILFFTRDLSNLLQLIEKHEVPIITTGARGLNVLEGKLQCSDYIQFNVEIEFNLYEKISGTIPSEIDLFSIIFTHRCHVDHNKNFATQDPFLQKEGYTFEVDITGYNSDDTKTLPYHLSLHLDKHIEGGDAPNVCHPYYHFHFGSNTLASKDSGELMILSTPRLAHPPMDIFLGVHFILDNFFNKTSNPNIKDLMADEDYQLIIQNAQKRLWTPYFKGFSPGNGHNDYIFEKLFPLFIHDSN